MGTAGAQEVRVAVVEPPNGHPMADRLADELRRAGLVPVGIVRPPASDLDPVDRATPPSLDALRAQSESRAGFEVVPETPELRLVVADPAGGASLERSLTWKEDEPETEALVGVQAVELLRAGLIETSLVGQNRAARLSLLELAQLERSGAPRLGVEVGPVVVVGTLDASPLSGLRLGSQVPVIGPLRAVVALDVGIGSSSWTARAGTIHLGESTLQLGARAVLVAPSRPWVPDVGLTMGLHTGRLGYDNAALFLPGEGRLYLRPGGALRAGITGPRLGRFAARAEGTLGIRPPVRGRLDGDLVGQWGPSSVSFGMLLDVVL